MDYSQLVSQAAAYTEKFINAAIPVAKQAYEIGLLTLQIDAVQGIVLGMVFAVLSLYLFNKSKMFYKKAREIGSERNPDFDMSAGRVITAVFAFISLLISLTQLLDVWLWVKLFKPELWLAKQAIAAVLNATGAK